MAKLKHFEWKTHPKVVQSCLTVQLVEHWQVNDVLGGNIQICFIFQLVEHWPGRFASKYGW